MDAQENVNLSTLLIVGSAYFCLLFILFRSSVWSKKIFLKRPDGHLGAAQNLTDFKYIRAGPDYSQKYISTRCRIVSDVLSSELSKSCLTPRLPHARYLRAAKVRIVQLKPTSAEFQIWDKALGSCLKASQQG